MVSMVSIKNTCYNIFMNYSRTFDDIIICRNNWFRNGLGNLQMTQKYDSKRKKSFNFVFEIDENWPWTIMWAREKKKKLFLFWDKFVLKWKFVIYSFQFVIYITQLRLMHQNGTKSFVVNELRVTNEGWRGINPPWKG